MSRRAVILAGGRGTRLKPYTVVLPKPLMPLGEYPILEVVVRQLAHFEFDHVTMAVNHQAELIKAFFGDGSKWGVRIDYSLEDRPLSTMGPLKLIRDLPENFLVMNGDVLTDLDFGAFHDAHAAQGNVFTISAHEREQVSEYGVLHVAGDGLLAGFQEKPVSTFMVSMGVYMAHRKVLDIIPERQFYGFDHLMLALIAKNMRPHVRRHEGYWMDIGRADDYQTAIEMFASQRTLFLRNE